VRAVTRLPLYACAALTAQAFFSLAFAADAVRGKQLYESRCIGCHSIDANRVGPAHKGVFGRKAGSVKGYDYSDALKKAKVIWNEKTLDRWLTNPEQLIPGQKMGFSVADAKDRADLIDYLRSESPKK
jgi:cytochrome c